MMTRQQHYQDQQSKVFYELSTLVLNLLRSPSSPSSASFLDQSSPLLADDVSTSRMRRPSYSSYPQITPAGFASLMLGVSVALMLCGSVTFFLGFILMSWVIGLIMLLYVAGVLSTISPLGRSIFCYATDPPPSPRKDITAWKML